MNIKGFLCLFTLLSHVVCAEQVQDISEISIQITQGCELNNGNDGSTFGTINFGQHSSLAHSIYATSTPGNGSIGFRCSPNLSYRIELGNGQNGTSGHNRQLLNVSTNELIPYQLYQDASRSIIWDSNNAITGSASGQQQWLTIYGAVFPQASTPSAGQYRDNVEVLIIF